MRRSGPVIVTFRSATGAPGDWPGQLAEHVTHGTLRRGAAAAGCGASARRAAARDRCAPALEGAGQAARHLRRVPPAPLAVRRVAPGSFTLSVLVLCSLRESRPEAGRPGVPEVRPGKKMIVKKVLTAPRLDTEARHPRSASRSHVVLVTVGDCFWALSDRRHRASPLTHGYSGQLNLAQMVRVVWSPSMPHSSATARTMSSPWCRAGSIIPWFHRPPLSSTSTRA